MYELRRWWWVGLVALACSVPEQDYGRSYGQALCEREQRCGRIAKALDCAQPDLFGDTFPQQPLLRAGLVTYSGVDGAACLQRLRDTTCATNVSLMPECRRAFPGTLGEGAACQSEPAMTCAPGLVCRQSNVSCGICLVATGEGQRWTIERPCDVGLIRFSDGGTLEDSSCVARRELDQRCERGLPCQPWLSCGDAGVCAFPKAAPIDGGLREAGEPCGTGQVPCKPGLRCVTERCTLLLSNGTSCGEDADCLSARCFEGRCSNKQPAGGACSSNEDCAGFDCVDGRCDGSVALCR